MPAVRAAGIDVGTNSFLLLILERDEQGAERVLLDRSDITRLGEGVDGARRLQTEPMDRSAATLAEYGRLLSEYRVEAVSAAGTSALRDAVNRDEFLGRVLSEAGLAIDVISGEQEADLTYAAVAASRARAGRPLLNLDIGGGSSELVLGLDRRVQWRRSLDIGAVRLHERLGAAADPPTADDLARLRALATAAVATVEPVDADVCGTGGTITTLAAIEQRLTEYDAQRVEQTRLSAAAVDGLIARLAALPLSRRRLVAGLPAKRADVILGGAVLLAELIRRLGVETIGVSAGGLRFALAREALDHLVDAHPDADSDRLASAGAEDSV